jgi:hypothetical protein
MKPKTKLQVRIMALSKNLPKIYKAQEKWSNKLHLSYYTRHYNNFICLECNFKWKANMPAWTDEISETSCLGCKNKIKLIKEAKPRFNFYHTFSIVTTVEEFQVIRNFTTWKNLSKESVPNYHTVETFQEWNTDFKKKTVVVGLNRNGSYYDDGFQYGSNFDIKNAYNPWGSYCYPTIVDFVYPEINLLPVFYRNGFDNNFYNCNPRSFLKTLMTSQIFETLVKLKNEELIVSYFRRSEPFVKRWQQIKICMKNDFKFTDFLLWNDYIDFLEYLKIDICNFKFICPEDLKKEHNFYMLKVGIKKEKLAKIKAKERLIEQEKSREENAKALKLKKKYFKDFQIDNGEFKIIVLHTKKQFKEEGLKLEHCLYKSDYYDKKDSLILSARINNEPIETIEVSLTQLQVLQIRGFDNEPTIHHNEILKLMNFNLPKIGRIVKKFQKQTA